MSTIRHPVQTHAWWYAAAAAVVMAGLLAVLMATVFSGSPDTVSIQPPPVASHHYSLFREVCSAGRPGGSIELIRTGCAV